VQVVPGGALEAFARAGARGGAWVEEHLAAAGKVHVDVGGEGRYPGAINLNPLADMGWRPETDTWTKIPNLVKAGSENLPIADHVVDTLTLESAPIRATTPGEIARVLKPGGEVFLLNPDHMVPQHQAVADAIEGARMTQLRDADGILYTHIQAPPFA
jgi:hypothetical protein